MTGQWLYAKQGKQVGPVTTERLQKAVAAGEVQATDFVWAEGMPQWIPAGQVSELAGSAVNLGRQASAPPPPPHPGNVRRSETASRLRLSLLRNTVAQVALHVYRWLRAQRETLTSEMWLMLALLPSALGFLLSLLLMAFGSGLGGTVLALVGIMLLIASAGYALLAAQAAFIGPSAVGAEQRLTVLARDRAEIQTSIGILRQRRQSPPVAAPPRPDAAPNVTSAPRPDSPPNAASPPRPDAAPHATSPPRPDAVPHTASYPRPDAVPTVASHPCLDAVLSPDKYRVWPDRQVGRRTASEESLRCIPGLQSEGAIGFLIWIALASAFYVTVTPRLKDWVATPDARSRLLVDWGCLLGVTIGGAFVVTKLLSASTRRAKIKAYLRKTAEDEANHLTARLRDTLRASEEIMRTLPTSLDEARRFLDLAESEFNENAFDPYWTAIEQAARQMAMFSQSTQQFSTNVRWYYSALSSRRHNFPAFPYPIEAVPDARPVGEALARTVRKGLTNYHFAVIWEHRKTRNAMVEGFQTLGEAVDGLGAAMESGLSDLRDALSSGLSDVRQSISSGISQLVDEQGRTRKTIDTRGAEHAQVLHKQGKMLDNIQSGHKPLW